MGAKDIIVTTTTDTPEDVQAAWGDGTPVTIAGAPVAAPSTPMAAAAIETPTTEEGVQTPVQAEPEGAAAPVVATVAKPSIQPKPRTAEWRKAQLEREIKERVDQKRAADAELIRVQQEIASARAFQSQQATPAVEPVQPTVETPTFAKPKPKYDDFLSGDDPQGAFIEALSTWTAEKMLHDRDVKATETAQQMEAQRQAAFQNQAEAQAVAVAQRRVASARAAHVDFDQVVSEHADLLVPQPIAAIIVNGTHGRELQYFLCKHPEVAGALADMPITQPMMVAIGESESAPALIEHLATNPAEALRIAQMPPALQGRELGRLEARLPEQAASTPPPAPRVQIDTGAPAVPTNGQAAPRQTAPALAAGVQMPPSNARRPVSTLQGRASSGPVDLESLTPAEYINARNEEVLRRRGLVR